jgi:hypothetical protein
MVFAAHRGWQQQQGMTAPANGGTYTFSLKTKKEWKRWSVPPVAN